MLQRRYLTALVIVVTAWPFAGCGGGEGQLLEGSVPAPSLRDNMLGDPIEQPVAVYLPPSYASTANRYPVVYVLPGYNTGVEAFLDGTYQGFSLRESLDRHIADGAIVDMIVVVVNGRNFLGGSFFANSPVTGNWEDFLVNDVVGYVDRNYRTRAVPEMRGLAGHSTGGNAALNVAMRHPDVFCAVYSMSPGLFDRAGLRVHGMLGSKAIIDGLLKTQRDLAAMGREAAHSEFLSYIEALFASGDEHDVWQAFTYAYGAAFSPDPRSNAPYIYFPHEISGNKVSLKMTVWNDWDRGFGRIDEKVLSFRNELLKLKAITVEIGAGEMQEWMLAGADYFSRRLDENGVPHELVVFDGGHDDRLRERIEDHMLPFFSRVFAAD
jgi:S-formylglutathione hydrolase